MRLNLIAALGLTGLTGLMLAGCVAPVPVAGPAVPSAPGAVVVAPPTILDAASRQIARNVVDNEMSRRLPGVNVSPYTDCVINNATTAELIDIAQMSRSGIVGTADSVATIVSRPTTTQCIAAAARAV